MTSEVNEEGRETSRKMKKDKAAQSFYHPLQVIKDAPGTWQRRQSWRRTRRTKKRFPSRLQQHVCTVNRKALPVSPPTVIRPRTVNAAGLFT